MGNDPGLLSKIIIFSDKEIFHLNGKVNRHNVKIWMCKNPHVIVEVEHNFPKVNVFYAVTHRTVYRPFFFEEPTITEKTYLEMITNWLVPGLPAEGGDYIFQQDGAPLHWSLLVRAHRSYLNAILLNTWIGRGGQHHLVRVLQMASKITRLACVRFFPWGIHQG